MPKLHLSLLGALVLSASSLSARWVDLNLPELDFSGKNTVWIALDAGASFGSTVIQVDASNRAFLAFQADFALRMRVRLQKSANIRTTSGIPSN